MPTAQERPLALRPPPRLPRLPRQKQKHPHKLPHRHEPRLLRNRPCRPLRARPAPPLHPPHRRRRNAPTARKFAALHLSAASRAKITSISRRFPARAQAAASASTIFAPPSKAVPLPEGLHEAHLVFLPLAPRRRARRLLRHLPREVPQHPRFSIPLCRAKKCTSATTKSSPCRSC